MSAQCAVFILPNSNCQHRLNIPAAALFSWPFCDCCSHGYNLGKTWGSFVTIFFHKLHSLWKTHHCYQTPTLFELFISLQVSSPSKLTPNLTSYYSKLFRIACCNTRHDFSIQERDHSPHGSSHVLATLRSFARPKLETSIRSSQFDCLLIFAT